MKRPLPASLKLVAGSMAAFLLLALITASAQEKKQRPAERPQEEAVRLHSDLVVLNVTVTDQAGQYVHGLTSRDFSILEDGAAQSVSLFTAEEAPFAATILIDMSGSMGYKFGLVRSAAATFIEQIRDNDQVAVYGFNNKIHLFQDFSNSRDISDYIWDAEARDSTRLYDCMDAAIDALAAREERRRAVLLISDGWDSSSSKASLDSVMKKALAAGITIYAVDLIDNSELMGSASHIALLRRGRSDMQEFASQSGGQYIHSPQGDRLEQAFTNIVEELRNQYTLSYYSTNDKRDGRWRKLGVGLSRQGLSARTRKGYFAPKK
ncbi:MAG TPA: VWA domain-containing protein [Blastocatellia bacterium]|nr:VWA domain-containing protein [Blastocatellia bacterium]